MFPAPPRPILTYPDIALSLFYSSPSLVVSEPRMESAAVTGQLLKGRGTAAGTSRHLFVEPEAWVRNDDRFKRWGLRVRSLTCRQAKLSAGVVAVCKPPTLGGGETARAGLASRPRRSLTHKCVGGGRIQKDLGM